MKVEPGIADLFLILAAAARSVYLATRVSYAQTPRIVISVCWIASILRALTPSLAQYRIISQTSVHFASPEPRGRFIFTSFRLEHRAYPKPPRHSLELKSVYIFEHGWCLLFLLGPSGE